MALSRNCQIQTATTVGREEHAGKMVTLWVPYPIGYYIKGMDGRIDDPNAGWKGRGLWSTTSTRAPFHMEGGKGTRPKVVKFQVRPDPLAK